MVLFSEAIGIGIFVSGMSSLSEFRGSWLRLKLKELRGQLLRHLAENPSPGPTAVRLKTSLFPEMMSSSLL